MRLLHSVRNDILYCVIARWGEIPSLCSEQAWQSHMLNGWIKGVIARSEVTWQSHTKECNLAPVRMSHALSLFAIL